MLVHVLYIRIKVAFCFQKEYVIYQKRPKTVTVTKYIFTISIDINIYFFLLSYTEIYPNSIAKHYI